MTSSMVRVTPSCALALTSLVLVQVEDTRAHAAYSAVYKREETEDAYEQLKLRPYKLPSTSRQTVMDRAARAWSQVDHVAAS